MKTSDRISLLAGLLLILVAVGLLTVLGLVYLHGQVSGLADDGEFMLAYLASVLALGKLLPALLLPYTIFFLRKPGRVVPSVISAVVCGALYPLLLIVVLAAGSGLQLSVHGSFMGWIVNFALALIPGTILSLLGTFWGRDRGRTAASCLGDSHQSTS